jgi:dTDP-4-amino-4,6-dideoxygalactose transaminase
MAVGVHQITADFEVALCKYTGAPYAIALDNMSNALFLALYYELNVVKTKYDSDNYWNNQLIIKIPANTYPSVACEIKHVGASISFKSIPFATPYLKGTLSRYLTGPYQLYPTKVWDSALSFTHNMYDSGTHTCLSFTGPYKHLKLGKGGAILTDDENAYKWFKKARFSGRDECSYHVDDFDKDPIIGWNMYLMPEISAKGLLLMAQFYDHEGNPKQNEDLSLPYPDLSKFKTFQG